MTNLQIVQSYALLLTLLSALMLLFSRLFVGRTSVVYERSRWLLIIQKMVISLQFVLQMVFGFRAMGNDVGAFVNILFYHIASVLMSFSILNLLCAGKMPRKFLWVGISTTLLSWGLGLGTCIYYDSFHVPFWVLMVISVNFFVTILYLVICQMRIFNKMRDVLEKDIGNPLDSFVRHLKVCMFALYTLALMLPCLVLNLNILILFGFTLLVIHVLVTVSFICIGASIRGATSVLKLVDEDSESNTMVEAGDSEGAPMAAKDKERDEAGLADETIMMIEDKITHWREYKGFADSELSIASFSKSIGVNRRLLSTYFSKHKECTFRSWITRIRVEEAMSILKSNPSLSAEAVAEECGFSSRSFYQTAFKSQTGYTPYEWAKNACIC